MLQNQFKMLGLILLKWVGVFFTVLESSSVFSACHQYVTNICAFHLFDIYLWQWFWQTTVSSTLFVCPVSVFQLSMLNGLVHLADRYVSKDRNHWIKCIGTGPEKMSIYGAYKAFLSFWSYGAYKADVVDFMHDMEVPYALQIGSFGHFRHCLALQIGNIGNPNWWGTGHIGHTIHTHTVSKCPMTATGNSFA